MNKKYVKTRQTNPNRTRSENNPNRIRNDPQMDWTKYNKGRHSKGQIFVRRMCRIVDITCDILGTAPGTRDRRVSTILMSILKSEENFSYWGLIKHFDRHPDDRDCASSRAVLYSMVSSLHIGYRSSSTAESYHLDGRRCSPQCPTGRLQRLSA